MVDGRVVRGRAAEATLARAPERAGSAQPAGSVVGPRRRPGGWPPGAPWWRPGGPALATPTWTADAEMWGDLAPRLYAQAAAGQWDPATAVDWSDRPTCPDAVEQAVVSRS